MASQQETDIGHSQPTQSNEDLQSLKYSNRKHALPAGGNFSSQARKQNGADSTTTTTGDKGNIFNETPKLASSTLKAHQQKQMLSAQSYTHKAG